MVVAFCPQIPDRASSLLGHGPSPLDDLVAAAQALERGGADGLVMPCNTAHAWYDCIAAAVSIPVLHIVDVALNEARKADACHSIGLLATSGTLRCGIYQTRGKGVDWITSTEYEQDRWVMTGIAAIKAGRLDAGAEALRQAAHALVIRGANVIILGCTEIPLALSQRDSLVPLVDSSLALARASVAWAGKAIAPATIAPLAHQTN